MNGPVKAAIGPWSFIEISPAHLLGRFNGFVKSVILRISEARDLGNVNRFTLYDHLKTYTAAPPDVLRVDEKNLREYAVWNVTGVVRCRMCVSILTARVWEEHAKEQPFRPSS